MPDSMIRPPTGSSLKVSGSSMAMVAIGPMPGSTPISVPAIAPMKANNRLAGVKATPKPMARLSTNSIALPVRPDRDGEAEPRDEDRPRQRDQDCGCKHHFERPQRTGGERTDPGQQHDREHEAE